MADIIPLVRRPGQLVPRSSLATHAEELKSAAPAVKESDAPVPKLTDEEFRARLYAAGRADGLSDRMIEEGVRDCENAIRSGKAWDSIFAKIFGGSLK